MGRVDEQKEHLLAVSLDVVRVISKVLPYETHKPVLDVRRIPRRHAGQVPGLNPQKQVGVASGMAGCVRKTRLAKPMRCLLVAPASGRFERSYALFHSK